MSICMIERLTFIFGVLGIKQADSDIYIRILIELGYDDVEFSFQDILDAKLDFMKVGHKIRFVRYLSTYCSNEAPLAELILFKHPLADIADSPETTPLLIIRKPLYTRDAIIVLKVIGCGSSGRVFKCLYAPSLTFVAVKVINTDSKKLADAVLDAELKVLYALSKHSLSQNVGLKTCAENYGLMNAIDDKASAVIISHTSPYIVKFYDAFYDQHREGVCLVMEFMSEGSLTDMLDGHFFFNEREAGVVAYSVAMALREMHELQLMHRDIKPENILCNSNGFVKLADFGIAAEQLGESKLRNTFTGTLGYMSPERVRGDSYGSSSDIWSLGVVLLTLLGGKPAFSASKGLWGLGDAIVNGKFPVLPADKFSPELLDFI